MPEILLQAGDARFRAKAISVVAAVFAMLVGASVLTGWILGSPELKGGYGDITMKANTAVTLIFVGAALLFLQSNHNVIRTVGQILAALTALVGLLTLSEHLVGRDLHIDQLLFTEHPGALATSSPGRMGITASSCFVLFGISLLLLYRRKAISLVQILIMVAAFWALLALIGYAYQAEQLFAIARYTGIALHTAAAIFILAIGILAACIHDGFLSILLDPGAGGRMARRLAVVGLVVPFVLGWLQLTGERNGFFGIGLGTALLVMTVIVIFLIAVLRAAIQLRRAERQRGAIEKIAKEGEERSLRQAALIDLSSEPIFVWNFRGEIVDWNEGCERLYGYSKSEAVGQSSHQLLKTEFPVSLEQHLIGLERDRQWSGELRHRTRDGRLVLVESRQQLVQSNGRQLVLETNRDITERRRAEDDLAQQRLILQVTLSSIGDAVIATDTHGAITFMNSAAHSLTGWGEEAYGRPLPEVFRILNEQTRAEVESPALRAMREGVIVGLANHSLLVTKDGREVPIDDSGAPIKDLKGEVFGAVLIFRDVSERRKTEREQALLAGIVESSDDAIVSKSLEGIISSWNSAARRLFGYDASEVIGKSITIIVPPDRLEEERTILEKLRRGERIEHFETERVTKSGELIPISVTVSPIRDQNGKIIGASKTARDITQRRQFEEEREQLLAREQKLRNEAQQANRIKDEFLITVSHELRTPLNAMLGWATLLMRGGLPKETAMQGMHAIERNAKFQAQLIEDLLETARLISGKVRLDIKPIVVTPIIQAALDSVRPAAAAKQIRLEMIVDRAADNLRADEGRLQQVIWNLLANSIKFTPRGGQVMVQLRRVDSTAEISVTDTGEGIRKEFLPFVFDRFQQADGSITRKHGGLGLGLAIARHLIELHGGTIEAASEGEGRGATFRIRLPVQAVDTKQGSTSHDDQPAEVASRMESAPPPNLEGVKVLAIDDAEDSREMIKIVLEQFGANVMTAASAREGFELFTGWKPDVLVCDIGMPEVDGYSMIQRIRMLDPGAGGSTPAVALTGYARVEDRMRALAAGYEMFVPKPVEAKELATLVETLWKSK